MSLLPKRFSYPSFDELRAMPPETVIMHTPFAVMRIIVKDDTKVIALSKNMIGRNLCTYYIKKQNYELAQKELEHITFTGVLEFAKRWATNV